MDFHTSVKFVRHILEEAVDNIFTMKELSECLINRHEMLGINNNYILQADELNTSVKLQSYYQPCSRLANNPPSVNVSVTSQILAPIKIYNNNQQRTMTEPNIWPLKKHISNSFVINHVDLLVMTRLTSCFNKWISKHGSDFPVIGNISDEVLSHLTNETDPKDILMANNENTVNYNFLYNAWVDNFLMHEKSVKNSYLPEIFNEFMMAICCVSSSVDATEIKNENFDIENYLVSHNGLSISIEKMTHLLEFANKTEQNFLSRAKIPLELISVKDYFDKKVQEENKLIFTKHDKRLLSHMFVRLINESFKTTNWRTNVLRELNLPHILRCSESRRMIFSDQIGSSRNVHSTLDCGDNIASISENNGYIHNTINLVSMMDLIRNISSLTHESIEIVTDISTTEIKTSKSSAYDPLLNPAVGQMSTNGDSKNNFDCNDFLQVSKTPGSEIDNSKNYIYETEKTMDEIVEENKGNHSNENKELDKTYFSDSDADELDSIIDESINKYEKVTANVSISATPVTAEKSCQTEIIDFQKIGKCKRCLEFEDQPTKMGKKQKLVSDVSYNGNCNFENQSTVPISIINKNDNNKLLSDKRILSSAIERLYLDHPNSLIETEDLLKTNSTDRSLLYDSVRQDYEPHINEEESLYQIQDHTNFANSKCLVENFNDSEQEVPLSLQVLEELPAHFSFVTPRKPFIRVGLSRSARFKPLHPRAERKDT